MISFLGHTKWSYRRDCMYACSSRPWHSVWRAERGAVTFFGGVACYCSIIKTHSSALHVPTHTRSRKTDWGLSQTVNALNNRLISEETVFSGCVIEHTDVDHLRAICTGLIGPQIEAHVVLKFFTFSFSYVKYETSCLLRQRTVV